VAWGNESAADESRAGDVIEQGTGSPGWRPSRAAIVLAAVTLLVGLAAGFAAGKSTNAGTNAGPGTTGHRPSALASATVTSPPDNALAAAGLAIEQLPYSCATQTGSQLTLGVELMNQSATAVTLTGLKTVFPGDAGALRELSWQWAPCGAMTDGLYQPTVPLPPGSTAWLSVTLKVLVRCPAAYPVQFSVSYTSGGVHASSNLSGFPDLGQVPYMGCPSQQSVSGSGATSSVLLSPAGTPCLPPQPEVPADRVTRTARTSLPSCMSW
jgi:hypothetical protein